MKNIIKRLIEEFGWTPEQVAYRTKASYRQVLRWRDSETKVPGWYYQKKLEQLLKQEEAKAERKNDSD